MERPFFGLSTVSELLMLNKGFCLPLGILAPVDHSTVSANPASFLDRNLKKVASWIESQPNVKLVGVGLASDIAKKYYKCNPRLSGRDCRDNLELYRRRSQTVVINTHTPP